MAKSLTLKAVITCVALLFALKMVDLALHIHRSGVQKAWEEPINGQGFRSDRDYKTERDGIQTRIAAMGDSFAFGWGVKMEEGYVHLLENSLNSGGERKAEVLNFGKYGFSALDEYNSLQEEYPKYKPDIVLWQFYVNDISVLDPDSQNPDGSWKKAAETAQGDAVARKELKYIARNVLVWAFPDLYNTLVPVLRQAYGKMTGYERDVFTDPAGVYRNWGGLYPTDLLPSMEPRWAAFEKLLVDAKDYVEKSGGKFVFVILPAEIEVGKQYEEELHDKYLYNFDDEVVAGGYMHKRLAKLCTDNKINCIDLLGAFKKADPEQEVFLRLDYHLTPFGNKVLAEELNRYLRENNFVK